MEGPDRIDDETQVLGMSGDRLGMHGLAGDEGHDRTITRLDQVQHRGRHAGGRRGRVVALVAFAVDERIGVIARNAQHELADARPAGRPIDRDEVVMVGDGPAQHLEAHLVTAPLVDLCDHLIGCDVAHVSGPLVVLFTVPPLMGSRGMTSAP